MPLSSTDNTSQGDLRQTLHNTSQGDLNITSFVQKIVTITEDLAATGDPVAPLS